MARIVVIDDEQRLLQTLARFLEQQGHEVVTATEFAAVSEQLYPGRFEVLITDIVMPGFDGMQVLREVVETRGCQEPVILITGEPNLETAAEAVRRGAFDYISKPVTKDKLLEAASRGLRHVQLLRERDRALQSEMEVLRNLARLGESASVLSHEIRTPITSLRHALRAVGEKLGVDDKILVEELLVNLTKIETMLGKTLSLVKPLKLDRQPAEIGPLLSECIRSVNAVPEMSELSIDIDVDPSDLRATVDPLLFSEVLVNLIRNAGEACSGHGHVELHARGRDGGVVLEVTDDGPGVPSHLRDEIFLPFRSSKEYGTGIGLAFSRKVVESHGGTIRFVNKPGVGACFRIELSHPGSESAPCEAASEVTNE